MDSSPTLQATAQALVAPHKGILAADESLGTIEKRLATVGLPSSEETRRAYRELLFTAPEIEQHLSGVILFDETIRQSSAEGVPFPRLLLDRGIIPGIKVDQGREPLPASPDEKTTKGLVGLAERLADYRSLGARFTKWRAVFAIGTDTPSEVAIQENANRLANYAALAQTAALVPIVEPEVLMDGDHSIESCEQATHRVLTAVFEQLRIHNVDLTGILLKPNMVTAGSSSTTLASVDVIATRTVALLHEVVPAEVPGIVFLSGGQSPRLACEQLNGMSRLGGELPWQLSFSYGRALQDEALKLWRGDSTNVPRAQQAFAHRAKLCSLARDGQYDPSLEG